MVLIIVIKNQTTKHIHVHSDHPSSITKQIQKSIKKRLSTLSSSKYIFHKAVSCYKQSSHQMRLQQKINLSTTGSRNDENKVKIGKRIIWFNETYNKSVNTDISIFKNFSKDISHGATSLKEL